MYLIHQSAQKYLQENYEPKLRPARVSQGHEDIAMYSIEAMSSDPRQNMNNVGYGFKSENMRPPQPDPLASLRYSCVFRADHLTAANRESLEHKEALADDREVLEISEREILALARRIIPSRKPCRGRGSNKEASSNCPGKLRSLFIACSYSSLPEIEHEIPARSVPRRC